MATVENDQDIAKSNWNTPQVYVLAAICFFLGIAVGYLFKGNTAAVQPKPIAASAPAPAPPMNAQPTPEQMRRMGDEAAKPFLSQLQSDPNNPALLAQVGNVYYDTRQYKEAIRYYSDSLKVEPKNVSVRADMATALYYLGDVDRALQELNTSLQYDPKHAQSLMNLGVIKWQGKMDIDGAVAAWEKLLKTNPDFRGAPRVKELIAQAKQHANLKPAAKSSKPL